MKICQKQFPETEGYYMDEALKSNLDIMVKHIKKDWDFVLLVSGSGQVRVGKSVMAMQLGYYLTQEVNEKYGKNYTFGTDNICFSAEELFKKSKEMFKFPYSVLIYDEAAADLMGTRILYKMTQALMEFFRECGQLNLFIIVVVPDFFDLPKTIALTRSIALIDVYYSGEFQRGYFSFFNSSKKKKLWVYGKKTLDYLSTGHSFHGRFANFYPINEQEYRAKKQEALKSRIKAMSAREIRNRILTETAIHLIIKQNWMSETELANYISANTDCHMSAAAIGKIYNEVRNERGEIEEENITKKMRDKVNDTYQLSI